MSRSAPIRALMVALVWAMAVPAAALADSSLSANWAGYAVHRPGVTFRSVSGTWKQPAANCDTYPTFEASWVGIGGYNQDSRALEQIGTELDCNGPGAASSDAWYELVPESSRQIRMKIKPGDTITASVTVIGHHVALKLTDRTSHSSFSKAVNVSSVDVRSADWIVEAPSDCFNDNFCRTLPLTDFGTVSFTGASATSTRGRQGPIASRLWGTSRITLAPDGRSFVAYGSRAEAKPSALASGGSSFQVAYSPATVAPATRVMAARAAAASAVNPGGRRG
jgi:hypothetical protein